MFIKLNTLFKKISLKKDSCGSPIIVSIYNTDYYIIIAKNGNPLFENSIEFRARIDLVEQMGAILAEDEKKGFYFTLRVDNGIRKQNNRVMLDGFSFILEDFSVEDCISANSSKFSLEGRCYGGKYKGAVKSPSGSLYDYGHSYRIQLDGDTKNPLCPFIEKNYYNTLLKNKIEYLDKEIEFEAKITRKKDSFNYEIVFTSFLSIKEENNYSTDFYIDDSNNGIVDDDDLPF